MVSGANDSELVRRLREGTAAMTWDENDDESRVTAAADAFYETNATRADHLHEVPARVERHIARLSHVKSTIVQAVAATLDLVHESISTISTQTRPIDDGVLRREVARSRFPCEKVDTAIIIENAGLALFTGGAIWHSFMLVSVGGLCATVMSFRRRYNDRRQSRAKSTPLLEAVCEKHGEFRCSVCGR